MEFLDNEVLNMIADFDEAVMRDCAEEEMFSRAMMEWEMNGVADEMWGG